MVRFRFLEVPARLSVESYVVFAVFHAEVVQEEKTNFRSVETAHSYVEHAAGLCSP